MKKIYLVTLLLFSALFMAAQNNWKVTLNNKTLLSTGKEDEQANCRKISAAAWGADGYLQVAYKDANPEKEWSRSIFFTDEADNELIRNDNTANVKISLSELKKAFAGRNKIKIFTTATPTDPDLAARVRIRRVHLCTLELP
jgi:hypothetical protein